MCPSAEKGKGDIVLIRKRRMSPFVIPPRLLIKELYPGGKRIEMFCRGDAGDVVAFQRQLLTVKRLKPWRTLECKDDGLLRAEKSEWVCD